MSAVERLSWPEASAILQDLFGGRIWLDIARLVSPILESMPMNTQLGPYRKTNTRGLDWRCRNQVKKRRRNGDTYAAIFNVETSSWGVAVAVDFGWKRATAVNRELLRDLVPHLRDALGDQGRQPRLSFDQATAETSSQV